MADLKAKLDALKADPANTGAKPDDPAALLQYKRIRREIRILERKVARAILVDPAAHPADKVAFGHWVEVEDDNGITALYRIVGEDEADPSRGWISWVSPLARALLSAEIEERVVWERPSGRIGLTVTALNAVRS